MRNIFKKSKKMRKRGYYWVHFAYFEIDQSDNRIGFFEYGTWLFPGDERKYYDRDLISINETRILPLPLRKLAVAVHIVITIVNAFSVGYIVYLLITHLTK